MAAYFSELFSTPRMAAAQVVGFAAMLSAIICFQQKSRKNILLWQLIVCSLWTLHFIILGVATGTAINALQVVRAIIFNFKEKKKWAQWSGWLYVFIALTIASGVVTWEGPLSILPVIGTSFSTISLWMKKPLTIRLLTFPVSITWGIYDFASNSLAGGFNEIFCIISLITAIIRIDIPARRREAEMGSLKGKTIIFLGSSVTYGSAANGSSFADFLEKEDGIVSVKEAKSGTTLVDDKASSYISRMKTIDKSIKADAFVCQLSTNDAAKDKPLGELSNSFEKDAFDTHTIIGAIEYIISYARSVWNCPVVFYTGTKFDSEKYAGMVDALYEVQDKWGIDVIDLWNNESMNNVSSEDYKQYMSDPVHPTRRGYEEWWTPVIRDGLKKVLT